MEFGEGRRTNSSTADAVLKAIEEYAKYYSVRFCTCEEIRP